MCNPTKEELEARDETISAGEGPSNRGMEWLQFSERVYTHIQLYTVPSYGDAPKDQVESWSDVECVKQIGKYVERYETNPRGRQECLRDLLKAAHYACLAWGKLYEKLHSAPETDEIATQMQATTVDTSRKEEEETPSYTIIGLQFPDDPALPTAVPAEAPAPTPRANEEPVIVGVDMAVKGGDEGVRHPDFDAMDLEEMITDHEGEVLHVYPDSKQIPTIGIGRNVRDNPLTPAEEQYLGATTAELMSGKKTITQEGALFLLRNDLDKIRQSLTGYPWFDNLSVHRQHALIDVCMMGSKKFITGFKETQAHIVNREFVDVAQHLLASKWAQDVKEKRAMEVALMMAFDIPFKEASRRYHAREWGELTYVKKAA